MAAVTVSRADDRLIAIKEVPPERAAETEREAGLLKQINHPGIVRFVDLVEAPNGGKALHTLFVSPDTWATRPLTDPVDRAAGVAALAAVLADLHDLGLAHRYLTAGHVLHGDDDRPVICSLTRADEATPENRRIDLEALADLTYDDALARGSLTGKLSSLADATREGQISARELAGKLDRLLAQRTTRIDSARSGDLIRSLRRAPKKATAAAGLGLVGTAAGIAALTSGLVWGSEQPTAESTEPSTSEAISSNGRRDPSDSVFAEAAIGSSTDDNAAGTDTDSVRNRTLKLREGASKRSRNPGNVNPQSKAIEDITATSDTSSRSPGDATAAYPTPGDATAAHPTPGDATAAHPTPGDATAAHLTPGDATLSTTDASEVSDATALATGGAMADSSAGSGMGGTVVEHQGRRYSIGIQGDIVRTGDWDCDGIATPSIVRPSTGAVALFEMWPDAGATIAMPARWLIQAPLDVQVEKLRPLRCAEGSHGDWIASARPGSAAMTARRALALMAVAAAGTANAVHLSRQPAHTAN